MTYNFQLHVVSVEKKLFDGIINKIQVMGVEGEMGIYPGHSPFITFIKPGILKISKLCNSEEYMYLSGGILEVQPNIVIILADMAIRAEDLDEKKAQESKRLAEEKIKNMTSRGVDYIKISTEISKAIAQLRLIELLKK
nr:F0F1 ATP synthase subunit epsilon [Candidatus Blochmannia vafer]